MDRLCYQDKISLKDESKKKIVISRRYAPFPFLCHMAQKRDFFVFLFFVTLAPASRITEMPSHPTKSPGLVLYPISFICRKGNYPVRPLGAPSRSSRL